MFKDSSSATDLPTLLDPLTRILTHCNGCGTCGKRCAFLAGYGTPNQLAALHTQTPDTCFSIAFECSLCGLCAAVCPRGLDPSALFLRFRQEAVQTGKNKLEAYRGILNYEKKGCSKRFSLYSLPDKCDTIFFPGCTLPGTRPDNTLKAFEYLKTRIDNIGIVLDCCTKPSHDLGRQNFFDSMFSEMENFLMENGINTIVVACPNCHKIFTTHGRQFIVKTLYEIMDETPLPLGVRHLAPVIVHDPCPVRFESKIHGAVRSLAQKQGLTIEDTKHSKEKTFCCGEGGSVGCVNPDLARTWTGKRKNESRGKKILTYCAGCVNFLSKYCDTFHVLDLMFDPEQTIEGKARVSKAPATYLNRLGLKKKLQRLPARTIWERPDKKRIDGTGLHSKEKEDSGPAISRLVLALIIAIMAFSTSLFKSV